MKLTQEQKEILREKFVNKFGVDIYGEYFEELDIKRTLLQKIPDFFLTIIDEKLEERDKQIIEKLKKEMIEDPDGSYTEALMDIENFIKTNQHYE